MPGVKMFVILIKCAIVAKKTLPLKFNNSFEIIAEPIYIIKAELIPMLLYK